MKNLFLALVVAVFGTTAIFADDHEMPKTEGVEATAPAAPVAEAPAAKSAKPAKKAKKAKKAKEHKAEEHGTPAADAAPGTEAAPAGH